MQKNTREAYRELMRRVKAVCLVAHTCGFALPPEIQKSLKELAKDHDNILRLDPTLFDEGKK